MSITGSLSNALSGLTVSSRAAELVSNNVANAMTEGYGRRELDLAARGYGSGGARVTGVSRIVDEAILRDRRLAEAGAGFSGQQLSFFKDLQQLVGIPDQPGSLNMDVADLESALIEASSRPDVTARLQAVTDKANAVSSNLNRISDGIQQIRSDADVEISRLVDDLNVTLGRVAEVNGLILRNNDAGQDISGLLDERQQLIDRISNTVPLQIFPRENGTIALYTKGGALLLDVKPASFEFTPTPVITSHMTQGAGLLSGLSINGNPVATSGDFSPIGGGELAALFSVRDDLAITAQAQVDAVARDLIERVANPSVDPTLTPTDPGFFTDDGFAFDVVNEVGLAGRIALNIVVDPAQGGDLWRLRDGINAPVQGPVGNNSRLVALGEALRADRLPLSGGIATSARSVSGLIGDFTSLIGTKLQDAEIAVGFGQARLDSLRSIELRDGVDTDQEMQKLLLIEQSYAANAKVVQTVDALIRQLLEL